MSLFFKLNRLKRSDLYDRTDILSVHLVYYFEGERISTSTGVRVKIKDWNDKRKYSRKKEYVLKTDPEYNEKNLILQQKLKNIKDIIFEIQKDDKIPTTNLVKSYLRRTSVTRIKNSSQEIHFEILFQEYYDWIKSEEYLIQTQNSKSYVRSLVGSMKDILEYTRQYQYINGIQLLPSDINREYINGLIKYCDRKGLQPSTIKKRIKSLVSFSKWLEEKYNLRLIIHKTIKTKKVEKNIIWLNNEELKKLFYFDEFEITNKNHTKHLMSNKKKVEYLYDKMREDRGGGTIKYTSYEVYKDMLIFICGTGMRFGDMCNLKIEDFKFLDKNNYKRDGYQRGEIEYIQQKTLVRARVPISKMIFKIYKKYSKNRGVGMYLFPRTKFGNPISNQKFNKHIKQVCRIVGLNRLVKQPKYDWNNNLIIGSDKIYKIWELVTSHIGRRTFIRELVDNGKDRKTIMSITGHRSYKTLDVYYESTEKDRFKNHESLHSTIFKNENTKNQNEFDLRDKLEKLKNLFEQGLIPTEVYKQKVSELL